MQFSKEWLQSELYTNIILQYKILFYFNYLNFENKRMYFISMWNTILYFDRKNRKINYKILYLLQTPRCISFSEREIHLNFKNNSSKKLFFLYRLYHISNENVKFNSSYTACTTSSNVWKLQFYNFIAVFWISFRFFHV